jgi:hypothetical protein
MSAQISPIELADLIRYDPETGDLYWKPRRPEHFSNPAWGQARSAAWSARYAGRQALTDISKDGYRRGIVRGVYLQAHRVCWAIHNGEWPSEDIDHINGVRTDNRAANLRVVSRAENARNQKTRSTNTSGCMGVSWSKRHSKWIAYLRRRYLGLFECVEDARAARKRAEAIEGFHPNHGRPQ